MDGDKTQQSTEARKGEALAQDVIADLIRESSRAGKLVLPEEIVPVLGTDCGVAHSGAADPGERFSAILRETMHCHEDLREIPGTAGRPRYYSERHMTVAYATLLVQKEGEPLVLVAETVRENSKVYPRPISRDTFKNEPFALTEEDIKTALENMKALSQYADIAQTVTSEGGVYLYSTKHLDPDHASMLAEWMDVGQYRNP